ncbi:MAG: DNA recombination protein RmuC [Sphingobacteriales bacterium]|nr:DNA recombination protein RmuC [Sphingobacteriales bacterium]
MSLPFYFVIIAFVAGVVITWLWIKSKKSAQVADLQAKLQGEIAGRISCEDRLTSLSDINENTERKLIFAEQQNAVLNSQLQTAAANQNELREANQLLKNDASKLNESLTSSLQAKTKIETQQLNTAATISELQDREKGLIKELNNLRRLIENLKEDNATLRAKNEETLVRLNEQQDFVQKANEKLKDAFNSLSAEALKNNNESFVTLAKATLETQVTDAKGELDKKQQAIDALVKPLSESLGKFDSKIQELEKVRMEQHGQINQYIQGVQQSTDKLQKETQSLVSALKTSHGRGRYGEIALRRVVEVAGMTEHCDFEEQVSVNSDEGRLRPDMIIRLPERKSIVVDSKVPLSAYMRAFETDNEDERKALLGQHAGAVRDHLKKLSEKAYWSQFEESPDWVVFYMQIESSFGAALQADPTLVEEGIKNRVIFATPTTLITLLRTVGFVWQQVSIAENIEQIRDAGIELYNRTTVLLRHFSNIGGSLKNAVTHYNSAVASLESRFVPHARKLFALGSAYTKSALPEGDPIEVSVRELSMTEEAAPGQDGTLEENDSTTPRQEDSTGSTTA